MFAICSMLYFAISTSSLILARQAFADSRLICSISSAVYSKFSRLVIGRSASDIILSGEAPSMLIAAGIGPVIFRLAALAGASACLLSLLVCGVRVSERFGAGFFFTAGEAVAVRLFSFRMSAVGAGCRGGCALTVSDRKSVV